MLTRVPHGVGFASIVPLSRIKARTTLSLLGIVSDIARLSSSSMTCTTLPTWHACASYWQGAAVNGCMLLHVQHVSCEGRLPPPPSHHHHWIFELIGLRVVAYPRIVNNHACMCVQYLVHYAASLQELFVHRRACFMYRRCDD